MHMACVAPRARVYHTRFRAFTGPVRVRLDDSEKTAKIGEIEVWCLDGSRAAENELDIADVCDSLGQMEADYVDAIYTDGSIDPAIVENPVSNDVLVIHSLTVQAKYHGQRVEEHIIRTIAETIGYHCGAVVLIPERVGIADADEQVSIDGQPSRSIVQAMVRHGNPGSGLVRRAGEENRLERPLRHIRTGNHGQHEWPLFNLLASNSFRGRFVSRLAQRAKPAGFTPVTFQSSRTMNTSDKRAP
jgi:hypothetical protein